MSGDTIEGVRKLSGKGNRLIILHAGGRERMGEWSRCGIQSKNVTGNNHDEMTAAHFEEWFHDSLLPNLIVMDNTPYHSCKVELVPTMSSTKEQMKDWLTLKAIEFPDYALKKM